MKSNKPVVWRSRIFPAIVAAVLCTVSSGETALVSTAPALPAVSASAATKYPLNLSPAWTVGQKFDYLGDASYETHSFTASSPPYKNGLSFVCHIEGDGEALAVANNGALTKMSLTVTAIKMTGDGKPIVNGGILLQMEPINDAKLPVAVNLPTVGAKLIIELDKGGHETFTIDGKPTAAGDQMVRGQWPLSMVVRANGHSSYYGNARFLRMVLYLNGGSKTDQDVFGPKESVAVGGSWPLDAAAMFRFCYTFPDVDAAIGTGPGPSKLVFPAASGTMTLESVTGSGDAQTFQAAATFTVSAMELPSLLPANPPPGVTLPVLPTTLMDFQGNLTISAPVTTNKGVLAEKYNLSIKQYPAPVQPPGLPAGFPPSTSDFKYSYSQQYTFK